MHLCVKEMNNNIIVSGFEPLCQLICHDLVKIVPCWEGSGNPLRTLAWKIPWTEEPGGLQSTGSLGVGHDWAT